MSRVLRILSPPAFGIGANPGEDGCRIGLATSLGVCRPRLFLGGSLWDDGPELIEVRRQKIFLIYDGS